MSNLISEVKNMTKDERWDRIYGLLQPHGQLRLYLMELKNKILSLDEVQQEEVKPKATTRRRRTTKTTE